MERSIWNPASAAKEVSLDAQMKEETPDRRVLLVEDDAADAAGFRVRHKGARRCGDWPYRPRASRRGTAGRQPARRGWVFHLPSCAASYHGVIIMLTRRGEEVDQVLGLQAGADDYLAKPVRPRALLARLQTHLRRTTPPERASPPIVVGSWVIDAGRRSVTIDGEPVELTTAGLLPRPGGRCPGSPLWAVSELPKNGTESRGDDAGSRSCFPSLSQSPCSCVRWPASFVMLYTPPKPSPRVT